MAGLNKNTIMRCRSPARTFIDFRTSLQRIYGDKDVPFEITKRSFDVICGPYKTILPAIWEEEAESLSCMIYLFIKKKMMRE